MKYSMNKINGNGNNPYAVRGLSSAPGSNKFTGMGRETSNVKKSGGVTKAVVKKIK